MNELILSSIAGLIGLIVYLAKQYFENKNKNELTTKETIIKKIERLNDEKNKAIASGDVKELSRILKQRANMVKLLNKIFRNTGK